MLLQLTTTPEFVPPPPKSPTQIPRDIPFCIKFSVICSPITPPPTAICEPTEPVIVFWVTVDDVVLNSRAAFPFPVKVLLEIVTFEAPCAAEVEPRTTATFGLVVKQLLAIKTCARLPPALNWSV